MKRPGVVAGREPGRPVPPFPLRATLGFLLGCLLAAAGCGVHGKDQTQVILRRLEGEPKTFNPLLSTSAYDYDVLSLVSRNLLDYDEKLSLVPGLAESVTPDTSHLVYTVKLRPNARWEDGTAVTSKDVAYTIRALMDPKTPSLNRRSFFDTFQKVETEDPLTARVFFAKPSANRLDAFNLPLLPAALYEGTDVNTNPRNRQPLANGPFRLARWDSGRTIELVRNTQYFGERAPAERVLFRLVPDSEPALQGLLKGDLDEMRLTYEQKKRVDAEAGKPDARATVVLYDELAYQYIGWNNRLPLFSDRRVRVALTMLVDREGITKTLYGGTARPSNGPVPPGLWSWDPDVPPWPYDPGAAEAALDAAGWKKAPDGVRRRGKDRFAFELSYGSGSNLQQQVVELIQQAYKKAGIEMALRPMEWGAFVTKSDAGDFEACALAMSLDPNPDMTMNWHSSQVPPNGFNSVYYRSPEADALMDELRTTFDRGVAKERYKKLQRLIHEDEPVSFLWVVTMKWGMARRIENVKTSPIGLFIFWPGASAWHVRTKSPG